MCCHNKLRGLQLPSQIIREVGLARAIHVIDAIEQELLYLLSCETASTGTHSAIAFFPERNAGDNAFSGCRDIATPACRLRALPGGSFRTLMFRHGQCCDGNSVPESHALPCSSLLELRLAMYDSVYGREFSQAFKHIPGIAAETILLNTLDAQYHITRLSANRVPLFIFFLFFLPLPADTSPCLLGSLRVDMRRDLSPS